MREFLVRRAVRIVFRAGALDQQAFDIISTFDRVVLIGSKRSVALPGTQAIAAGLGSRLVATIDEVIEHVPFSLVESCAARLQPLNPDCLLVVGGGSAIGLAKGLVVYGGLDTRPRIVCIPTTYSGSEMTAIVGVSKLTEDGKIVKQGSRHEEARPAIVVYDSTLLTSLPLGVAIPSIFNALAHSVEALWADGCGPLSRMAAIDSIVVAFKNLPLLKADPHNLEAVDSLLYCAYLAGQALDSEEMALQHRLAHVLGGSYHLPHAQAHMTILPHVIAYNRSALPAELAERLQVDDVAGAMYDLMISLLGGAPSLSALGFGAEEVEHAVDAVIGVCANNPVPLEKEGLMAMLERALRGERPPGPDKLAKAPPLLPSLPLQAPRVPYLNDAQFLAKSPQAAATILERRKGSLLNLDRVLMHAPAVAQVVNEAYYEYYQHYFVFLKEGGTVEEADWLGRWRRAEGLYSDRDRAVLEFVDAMTMRVHVSDDTAKAARACLSDDQQMVELTALCAGYNMVSRFLEALRLMPEKEEGLPPMPSKEM